MYHFWRQNPLFRPALFLMTGILFQDQFLLVVEFWLVLISAIFFLLFLPFFRKKRITILLPALFLALGALQHSKHFHSNIKSTEKQYLFHIEDEPALKMNGVSFTARAQAINGNDSGSCRVQVYLKGTYPCIPARAGDLLLVRTSIQIPKEPANPSSFNYKKYLERKGIHFQCFLDSGAWTGIGHKSGFRESSYRFRTQVMEILDASIPDSINRGILKALVCGYSRELDGETRSDFASSGTMHMLAVSGMHVGILLVILNLLLFKLRNAFARNSLLILSLWAYALFTGLSPSVVRACSMCSLYLLGDMLDRQHNAWNAMAFALLVLLVSDTNNLFNAGFQLSFLALTGILLSLNQYRVPPQSRLEKWKQNSLAFVKMSVAAQCATFPVSALLFGQFPLYFLIGNILIVPLAAPLMYLGISLVVLHKIPILSTCIIWILNHLLLICRWMAEHIAALPFSSLHLNFWHLEHSLVVVLAFIAIIGFWKLKSSAYFFVSGWMVLFLLLHSIHAFIAANQTESIIVFSDQTKTRILFRKGNTAFLLGDSIDSEFSDQVLIPHLKAKKLRWMKETAFEADANKKLEMDAFVIHRCDSLVPVSIPKSQKPVFVLLERQVEYQPHILSDSFNFCNIVLCSNLDRKSRKIWLNKARETEREIYDIRSQGAFEFNLWKYSFNMK